MLPCVATYLVSFCRRCCFCGCCCEWSPKSRFAKHRFMHVPLGFVSHATYLFKNPGFRSHAFHLPLINAPSSNPLALFWEAFISKTTKNKQQTPVRQTCTVIAAAASGSRDLPITEISLSSLSTSIVSIQNQDLTWRTNKLKLSGR